MTGQRRPARSGSACPPVGAEERLADGAGDPGPDATPGPLYTEVAPLRDAAARTGRLVGAAVYSSGLASDATYAGAAGRHFNYLTAEWEMKWDPIQKSPGVFDFSGGDRDRRVRRVARDAGQGPRPRLARGDPEVGGGALAARAADRLRGPHPDRGRALPPPGLRLGRGERGDRRQPGRACAAPSSRAGSGPTTSPRPSAWRARPTPRPSSIYNDYGGEGLNRKSNDVYALVKDLKQRGLVDGVGLQMHISAAGFPAVADIQANIQRLADLGLQVNISEMDVRVKDVAGDAATKLARQRQVYRDVVAACVAVPRCEAVTLWGFTDAHSWIDSRLRGGRPAPLRRAVPGQARLLRRGGRVLRR